MLAIAKINHNELERVRVTLSIDTDDTRLRLMADGEKLDTPAFANLKEVDEYVGTTWGSSEWELEWLVEDLPDLDNPVRLTLRIPGIVHEKIWQIHSKTKKSLNQIIVNMLEKELGKRGA